MELEFNLDMWLKKPNEKKRADWLAVGWALVELSLEDPDYETVLQEIKRPGFQPRLSAKSFPDRWN